MKKGVLILFFLCFTRLLFGISQVIVTDMHYSGGNGSGSLKGIIKNSVIKNFNKIPGYTCIDDNEYTNVKTEKGYELINITDKEIIYNKDIINELIQELEADYCVIGQFEEDEVLHILKLCVSLFSKTGEVVEDKRILNYFSISQFLYSINAKMESIIDDLITRIGKSGRLTVHTDPQCQLYIDNKLKTDTFNNIPVKTGLHDILAVYTDMRRRQWTGIKRIYIKENETTELSMHFMTINIDAPSPCLVLIDNKVMGRTPFRGKLINNKDFNVKVIFTDPGGRNHVVYSDTIVTVNGKNIPPIKCSLTGKLAVTSDNENICCRINEDKIVSLPFESDSVPLGPCHVEVLLEYIKLQKYIPLKDEFVQVAVNNKEVLDYSDIRFDYKRWLCFIPGAAQFYNGEPGKGKAVIGLLTCMGIGGAGFFALSKIEYNKGEDTTDDNSWDYYDKSYKYWGVSLSFFTMAGITYLYSMVNGWATMNNIYNIVNS